MKRTLLSLLLLAVLAIKAAAMPYEEARDRAWFLTDKMAYELNLTPEQYDRAYEINLNYFMSIRTASDCYGYYWNYRDADFRCILFDWQYNLFSSIDYFFRPIRWVRSSWYYPVCDHYRYGYYYFDRPAIYVTYHGGAWRRRSHNDPSPYRGMHFSRGHGMRDNYRGHRPGADYHRPGRPDGHHRPDGGHRPGDDHKGDRPQANRPGNGNHGGNHGDRPQTGRPGNDNHGGNHGGGHGNRPQTGRPDNGNHGGMQGDRPQGNRPSMGNQGGNQGGRPQTTRPSQGRGNSGQTARPSQNRGSNAGGSREPSARPGNQRSSRSNGNTNNGPSRSFNRR